MTGYPWPLLSEPLVPTAAAVGPFATADFYRVWWDNFAQPNWQPVEITADDSLLALVDDGECLCFAGHADVTDYHTSFGDDPASVARKVTRHPRGRTRLDSIPTPQAEALAAGLREGGATVDVSDEEVTTVVDLPATFDEYLAGLSKKQRHEVRRKRRRYTLMLGDWEHVTEHGDGVGFDEFVRLHRSAPGDKGEFMSPQMEDFFADLIKLDGWRIDLLRHDDTATATVFGYCDDTGYYLYNSSFDSSRSDASPGWVLLASMIETAIGEGMGRFDFLKGNESYKFKLGADPRTLSVVEASW